MKKVTLTYTREDPSTSWYALSEETKSADFQAYRAFVDQNVDTLETGYNSETQVSVDMYFTEENYPQFETLFSAIQPEVDAYNANNNISVTKTVTDV